MSVGPTPGVTQFDAYDPAGLLMSLHDVYTARVTLLSGENRTAGTLLGKITTGGKYKLSTAAASDGSQLMSQAAILLQDCDASGGDESCIVLLAGGVDAAKMTFGAGHTAASVKEALAARGIYLYDSYSIKG